jgi:hypothetical protein
VLRMRNLERIAIRVARIGLSAVGKDVGAEHAEHRGCTANMIAVGIRGEVTIHENPWAERGPNVTLKQPKRA